MSVPSSDTPAANRHADHQIQPMFLDRWSPRAFADDRLSSADLLTMLEAARWAASSYNAQPWRFLYALRDTEHWSRFLDLLVSNNRSWAANASALVLFVSRALMRYPGADHDVPSPTHRFDTGTASGYFSLQASLMGWSTHGMVGFDHDKARADLRIPPEFCIEAIYAVGRMGDASSLPEALRARERPSNRTPLADLAFEGWFPDAAASR